jgi:ACS family tartrate transporter-like MFS transporter
MVGAFVGPYAWGVAKDYTGGYQAGLISLAGPYLIAAALVLLIRRRARAAAQSLAVAAAAS